MKISLGSWAFTYGPYERDPIPFLRVAERLSEAGYDGIEVGGFEPHVTLERYPDYPSRAALCRNLTDLNLGISGYAADFWTIDPTVAANKQRYLEAFSQYLDLCNDLGSPSIRVDAIAAPETIPLAEQMDAMSRLAELWHEAAERAQHAGIAVVWEFEPCFVFNKPSEVKMLVDKVAHPNFRVMFDTSHAYMCAVVGARQVGREETLTGGIAEFLDLLEGRIGHIHVIDSDGTLHNEDTSAHPPFGVGKIDFEPLVPRLLAIPGIEWWCIDMCFWAGSWELVDSVLAFVKGLLGVSEVAASQKTELR